MAAVAYCPDTSPTPGEREKIRLSPFRWLDVVLSLPSHQVRRCGEIGGGRYVTVGLLLGRAAVLVLWPRRGVLAGRVREGAAAAVKTNPGRELRRCMRRQFLRLLLGRASDRPWSQSPRRLKHCAGRLKHCAGGSSAGRFKRGAVQARDGARTVRGGSSTARGTARGGAARGGLEGETLRGAGRSCGSSTARGGSVLAGRVIEGSAAV